MTTYRLELIEYGRPLGCGASPDGERTAHRSLAAAARRNAAIQSRCRAAHGASTWVPTRIYAVEDGVPRPLNEAEEEQIYLDDWSPH